jgi:tetratricopeptide (TPR) repeat protein
VADAAAAYVEWIDREAEALLRAELYWRLGDTEEAWGILLPALAVKGVSADRSQREHLIWTYRALAEGRYDTARDLLDSLGLLTGEPERRRQAQVASAAVFASAGRKPEARRKLEAALKATRDHEVAGVARLQVVLALLRGGHAPDWAGDLLEEAAVQIGDDHPDLIKVLALKRGERTELVDPESYPGFGGLAYDPRSGRLFPAGLSRGTPSGARLATAQAFVDLNRTRAGLAWPFGPAFHPISGEALQVFFHPGR